VRLTLAAVLFSASSALAPVSSALALDIGHTRLPEKLRLFPEGTELLLNGAGLRSRFLIEVYVIGLYLPERKKTDVEVLAHAGGKRVRIVMLRDVTARQMTDSLLSVMHKNNGKAELAAVQAGIEEFQSMLLALNQVPKGTTFDIDYSPRSGTRFAVDGIPKGRPIAGESFYRAVLRIWIGDKPEQPGLKQALLGR
jgi:hypothetical protein